MPVDYASAQIEYGGTPSTVTLLELAKQLAGVIGSSEDELWTLYCQFAGEAAESYCDNKLVSQSVVQNIIGLPHPILLRHNPATSFESIIVDGLDVTSDYVLYTEDGLQWLKKDPAWDVFVTTPTQTVITFTSGFDPLPAEVGYAIARAATEYQRDDPSAAAPIKKESVVGVGSLEYDTKNYLVGEFGVLTKESTTILDKYKRHNV